MDPSTSAVPVQQGAGTEGSSTLPFLMVRSSLIPPDLAYLQPGKMARLQVRGSNVESGEVVPTQPSSLEVRTSDAAASGKEGAQFGESSL